MESAAIFLQIAVVWTVAAVTPGPNFFVTAYVSASSSARVAAFTALGIVAGTAIWGCSGVLGAHLLFWSAPWTHDVARIAGGSYLLWLGVRLATSRRRNVGMTTAAYGTIGAFEAWRRGFMTNLSNPKTALFTATLFAAETPANPPPWLGIGTVATMLAVSLIWYMTVACLFGSAVMTRNYKRHSAGINVGSGVIFAMFGLLLIVEGLG